jgi:PAS domain-containing protein
LWASKHYFDVFWEKNDREYVTRPYLDFGGNGLIRTRCDALERQDDRQLLGILCTDFTLPRIPLLKKINDGPLFYGNTVEIHRDAPQLVRFDLPENERRPSAQLEASLRSLVASQTDSLVKLRRQITRVPSAEGVSFLIPIGSRHRDDILYALLLTPRDVTSVPVITWSRVAWLSFGGLTLGLLLSGVVISDRTAELSRRLTLLRNLQVGVAQANNRDWILEANDRAEELFRRKLPKRRVARPSVNFSQLIDEWVIPIEPADDNYLGEPCGRGIRYSRSQEKRERGEASIYYARLRGAEPQWLRVSASPILFSEKTRSGSSDGQLGADFGVVDQVSKDLAGRLETIWQTSRRLSNDG